MEKFENISSEIYLPGISPMIQVLLKEAQEGNENTVSARAALQYLVEEHDVIPDSLGYVGLVDDIFVIGL